MSVASVSAEQVGDALQPLDVEYHPEPSVLVDPDAHPGGGPGARAAVRPPRPAAPGRDRARA